MAVGLVSCAAEEEPEVAPSVAAVASQAGSVTAQGQLAESAQGAAFVAALKAQFPQWAGRSDEILARYGARICLDDLTESRQVALTRLPGRFENSAGRPSVQEAEAILALVVTTMCPEKAGVA